MPVKVAEHVPRLDDEDVGADLAAAGRPAQTDGPALASRRIFLFVGEGLDLRDMFYEVRSFAYVASPGRG